MKIMKNQNKLEIDRVDTLIITVGTRQIGWRCQDGIIRCLGADGDRNHPPHINQLYQELKIERQYHDPNQTNTLWSVRDLGERFYQHCTEWLENDFSSVELLIDQQIIADFVKKKLQQIILFATDQPDAVGWNFRRSDTIWLAKLMQGKIKSTWPQIQQVEVFHPQVKAIDKLSIRQEIEGLILPFALEFVQNKPQDTLVLAIENKGAVPAVAESLEICAAGLVRQCQIINATPIEPDPLYLETNGEKSAQISTEYDLVPVSQYFWPLERLRVISAWERGDFAEAQIWLEAHKIEYNSLYQLAGYLAVCNNWDLKKFLKEKNFENAWLRSKFVLNSAGSEQAEQWRSQLSNLKEDGFLQTWESIFLIELLLKRGNYTQGFMQFSQTLERLLYLEYKKEKWVKNGFVTIPKDIQNNHEPFNPSFSHLINGWVKYAKPKKPELWHKFLHQIREKRNDVVHQAEPMSLANLRLLWANNGFAVTISEDSAVITQLMLQVFQEICQPTWDIPAQSFLRSLYLWGLKVLRADSPLA